MASSTGITSISAEFSVGSSTSKTMISMATSRQGISMVTTSSITHVGSSGEKDTPTYSVMSLRPADPLSSPSAAFIKEVLKGYCTESLMMYSYSLTHPAALTYMVLLGGLLFQYGISKALAVTFPPLLAFYIIKSRLRAFSKKHELQYRSDLSQPSRYYNERKRALFVAVQDAEDTTNTSAYDAPLQLDGLTATETQCPPPPSVLGTVAVDTEQAGGTAVIRHLCVHPAYRRLGIGQALLSKAMAFCEHERFQRVVLSTNNLQGPAEKLCRHKHAFRPITQSVDLAVLPGVDITRTHFVRCLRARHTSSCCR